MPQPTVLTMQMTEIVSLATEDVPKYRFGAGLRSVAGLVFVSAEEIRTLEASLRAACGGRVH